MLRISIAHEVDVWNLAMEKVLPNPLDIPACADEPLYEWDFLGYARYIKVETLDHYGAGPGYDYFNVVTRKPSFKKYP